VTGSRRLARREPAAIASMKIFNLNGDEWDEAREREGWRIKEAFVGHRIGGE
jgi:hypothetical protein